MALINCAECGKEISDKAAACISCGAPIDAPKAHSGPQTRGDSAGVPRFGALIVLGISGGLFAAASSIAEARAAAIPALILLGVSFNIWRNYFSARDAHRQRAIFSLSDFFTVPGTRQNKKRNIIIFCVFAFFCVTTLIGIIGEGAG